MGMTAVGRHGARSLAGALLAGAMVAGACASETDVSPFRGEAPPMPADVDVAMEEALAAVEEIESAEAVARITVGPDHSEAEGQWTRTGVGRTTAVAERGPELEPVETEARSDGETAWVRSDDPAFLDTLPAGTEWIEAPRADLLETGVLTDFDRSWDALLFARNLDEVEDGGVGTVNGDLVRVIRAKVHYEAAYNGVSPDERERMDAVISTHDTVRDFTAEIALDSEGRVRRIDYDLSIGIRDSPGLPMSVYVEFLRLDQPVEPPPPPDPDDVVPASEVPEALVALGAEPGAVLPGDTMPSGTPGDTTPGDEGESEGESADIDDPAGVLDRDPPEPEPPPADTPADAVETTTLIEGEGSPAAVGDTVYVHYVLVLADGQVPDSSWDTSGPFSFTIGGGAVIAGWDEGLVGARAGERRRLVIGADKAYGSQGAGDIPPDAPLAFEVDVVSIDPAG